jgi:hypothetical protein
MSQPSTSDPVTRYRPISAQAGSLARDVVALRQRVLQLQRDLTDVVGFKECLDAVTHHSVPTVSELRSVSRARTGKPVAKHLTPLLPFRDIAAATTTFARSANVIETQRNELDRCTERLMATATSSAKNTFEVLVCRLQLRRFLSQWGDDRAFCHRCGSGPYSMTRMEPSTADTDGQGSDAASSIADTDDAPPACAVCSTLLRRPDPSGGDVRAVQDFEAQIIRRRVAVLEAKMETLAVLLTALKGGLLSHVDLRAIADPSSGGTLSSTDVKAPSPTRPSTQQGTRSTANLRRGRSHDGATRTPMSLRTASAQRASEGLLAPARRLPHHLPTLEAMAMIGKRVRPNAK